MIAKLKEILKGINQTEIESQNGWWETSIGAKFGEEKLQEIIELFEQVSQKKEWVGLTDDERIEISWGTDTNLQYAIAIEAKLKEKNL